MTAWCSILQQHRRLSFPTPVGRSRSSERQGEASSPSALAVPLNLLAAQRRTPPALAKSFQRLDNGAEFSPEPFVLLAAGTRLVR